MDITPTPDGTTPKYPKKKRCLPPDVIDIQVESGVVMPPPHLTKTDCRLARRILKNGLNSMTMQLMGGAPVELRSAEAKAQERRYRQHMQAYDKLMWWLDYMERGI